MKVSLTAIKALRDKTSASINDVKEALTSAEGDEKKALALLKKRGAMMAAKRAGRSAGEGRVETYVHHDGKLGAIVEVNCETDFVARTSEFSAFCRDVAMHVAAMGPSRISPDESGDGDALLEQTFVKDPGTTVGQMLTTFIGKTGENVVIRRFTRFGLGEATE